MRRALPLLLVALALRPALAQCPDGTPPPCVAPRQATRLPSVAVLFVEPRSRNAADSLLAEGLTLEIISTLGGVQRLDVRSRWVSRRIAAAADPMRSAAALGVDYVVDGVLELDSARVLVRGALTRTSTGRVVRPLRIERRRVELDALQAAVAQEVASAVVGQLLPSERAGFVARRVAPRAIELMLRARALAEQHTPAAVRQAMVFAREVVSLDPTYADGWAQLALTYALSYNLPIDSAAFYVDQALAASERALALDSANGRALAVRASVRAFQNDVSPLIEAQARRAAILMPGSVTGSALAIVLLYRGHVEEALSVSRAAVQFDSLAPAAWSFASSRFFQARRFAEAAAAREHLLGFRPSAADSAALLSARRWALLETGDCAGALAAGRAAGDPMLVIETLRCLGRAAEADSVIDSLLGSSTVTSASRAVLLSWRGQPDSAFAVLNRSFPGGLGVTLQHPAFDPYRQHPAYLALRRRMGLEN